jgi:hypothetical protein
MEKPIREMPLPSCAEVSDSPIAEPKVRRSREIADASTVPAKIAGQST